MGRAVAGAVRLIGVAGPSGSGKTTLARALAQGWADGPALVLSADDYYRDLGHLSATERESVNFDHPEALDLGALARDLAALRLGLPVLAPSYDFATHTRGAERRRLEPAGLVVVEGVLILHSPEVRAELDLKVYVDAPLDLCLLRRLRRDLVERGRSVESVLSQYETTVRPMALAYVIPQRDWADLAVSGEGESLAEAQSLLGALLAALPG
jgi:uridine kinase